VKKIFFASTWRTRKKRTRRHCTNTQTLLADARIEQDADAAPTQCNGWGLE